MKLHDKVIMVRGCLSVCPPVMKGTVGEITYIQTTTGEVEVTWPKRVHCKEKHRYKMHCWCGFESLKHESSHL